MTDIARRTGPALEAHQRFIFWLVPTVERFPRAQKFLLGDRIQSTALDVLEALIEATYTRDRRGYLALLPPRLRLSYAHISRPAAGLVEKVESFQRLFGDRNQNVPKTRGHLSACIGFGFRDV